ncbi:MAG: hypothetical protein NC098_02195 [Lachnoclostridium sp.]|nr:hypothetical protein [Lachnoclostridium sp.]
MKKYILSALLFITTAFVSSAQVADANTMILHYKNGQTVTFSLSDLDYMEFDKVETEEPTPDEPVVTGDPKVGDYFYSDGTWSDGGLISIDADGRNAVWAAEKPAPIEGKTVVGIVFCTNPDRMADVDKEAGFTHGYVIACKNITDPKKSNYSQYPETVWYAGQWATTDVVKVAKLASSCYENLKGSEDTKTMFAKNDPKYYDEDIPLFYNGTTLFPVKAPENTSGWFIPSIGQLWDCVANFCSGEVASYLSSIQADNTDFSYCKTYVEDGTVPFDEFMKVFAKVPDDDKDDMVIPEGQDNGLDYISLGCATRYDTESRLIINLGMNGGNLVEGMIEWFDGEAHSRPILAF